MTEIDYSKCTEEDFDRILHEIVGEMDADTILSYGDVHVFFREELNNAILERWAKENGLDEEEDEEEGNTEEHDAYLRENFL